MILLNQFLDKGELNAHQTLDVSQSWIPKKSGDYEIETFVWNSINDPTALGSLCITLQFL